MSLKYQNTAMLEYLSTEGLIRNPYELKVQGLRPTLSASVIPKGLIHKNAELAVRL